MKSALQIDLRMFTQAKGWSPKSVGRRHASRAILVTISLRRAMEIPLFNSSILQPFGFSRDHGKGPKVEAKEPAMKERELLFHSSAIASKRTAVQAKEPTVRKAWHHDIGVRRTILSFSFDQEEEAKLAALP